MDRSGKWVFTGNYSSGTAAVNQVFKGGKLSNPTQVTKHFGSGPNSQRQESPHVHGTFLSPDEKYIFFIRSSGQQITLDNAYFYWVSSKIIEKNETNGKRY